MEGIIQSIKAAEAQAADIKNAAETQAANILADAEKQAARLERAAFDVCKAYKETQLKQAVVDAEKAYQDSLYKKAEETTAYCARILENSDAAVSSIVGRIISGNC